MMVVRKNKVLDGIDREILRALYINRPLVTRQIAKCIGISCSAVVPRLNNLMEKGIIKQTRTARVRSFERVFGNKKVRINSPQSIYWDLDLK